MNGARRAGLLDRPDALFAHLDAGLEQHLELRGQLRALRRLRSLEPRRHPVAKHALGAGTRLLGNASPSAVEQGLRMLDGCIDALAGPSALLALS